MFFWPLTFHAFGAALQVFPRWYSGGLDGGLDGAHAASSRARSLCLGGLFTAWCLSSAFG
ncbi:hypothetical protein [Rhodococcus tibetensis]|uniref:Uncharacterized protein n=1 Tax=Rhodococcus tibetensis TaxID=2965064 RepID=A0ABT1Q856_9NOCA|nr:hypothetical protein [Rhodococcus sp. FXJ9.536]MCQ4118427.1 hypothetical protein [Rhodococcus sp. FXJ9.536]